MKRFLVVLLVLAFVATGAFAQVSGVVLGRVEVLNGDNGDDSDLGVAGNYGRVRLQGGGQTEDGVWGGYIRLDRVAWWTEGAEEGVDIGGAGWAWWQPNEMFRLTIGQEFDGMFGMSNIARYGMYQEAGDLAGVITENWIFSQSFYGGWSDFGALITLTPVEGLTVHVAIPYGEHGLAEDAYKNFTAQLGYDVPGIGLFGLTIEGGNGDNWSPSWGLEDWQHHPESNGVKFFGYAGLTMVEDLFIELGLGFQLPSEQEGDVKYTPPFSVGLAAEYRMDQFGLRFRGQGQLGEKLAVGDAEMKGPTVIDVDLLPFYQVSGNLGVFFGAGLSLSIPDEGDSAVGFHINPYIVVGNQWSSALYVGFRLEGASAGDDTAVSWSIPVSLAWKF